MGDFETRFWSKVDQSRGPDACWPWTGGHNGNGYGALKVGEQVRGTHVIALELHSGEAAGTRWALHGCANPPCCNPKHLRWGTAAENSADINVHYAAAVGKRLCRECLKSFEPRERAAVFCSTPCRKTFNNRRAMRGQAMYDLMMALRYQRGLSKARGLFSLMCALAQEYRQEDVASKGHGWRSWVDPDSVLALKPWLRAKASSVRP